MILDLIDEAVRSGARQGPACEILGLSARGVQRWRRSGQDLRCGPKSAPSSKLSTEERQHLLEVVNSPRYRNLSPHQIVPLLADEGLYLASEATIYRVLREEKQLEHRHRTRPATHSKPREHVATGPNEVWAWDITYLSSPVRGQFFYLYLILDVWSRKIVAAQVHGEESADLAGELFRRTCAKLAIDSTGLVLHSDNGSPMKGSTMQATLRELGVTSSFSRPYTSNDNPHPEALFRTLKYRPAYPSAFADLTEAQAWVDDFVSWYNTEHLHSGIRFVTPEDRHHRRDEEILEKRRRIYESARCRRPERWSAGIRNWTPVGDVRLNPDKKESVRQQKAA